MSQPVQRPRTLQTLQFAGFRVDLHARELRRNGNLVRLQEQPFSVLAVLLEHAGDVVTREELRQHLWPSDTFVDFDNSLNTAINKIREALGDSVEDPHFVETLPRRGYRFIAPVNGQNSQGVTESSMRMLRPFLVWMGAGLVTLAGVGAIAIWLRSPISPPRIVGSKQITNDGTPKTGALVTDGARIYFGEFSSGRCPLRSCRLSPRTNRTYCCNRVISRLRGAIFGSYPYPPVLRTISKASSDMVEDGHPPPTADLPLAKAAIYLLPITTGATLVRSPPRLVRLAT